MKIKPRNYDEYIEQQMENVIYNQYNKLQTIGNLSIGNTCKVIAEWCPEIRKYKCRILGFQKNSNKIFAQVKWLGSGSDLYKKYGSLWSVEELIKV